MIDIIDILNRKISMLKDLLNNKNIIDKDNKLLIEDFHSMLFNIDVLLPSWINYYAYMSHYKIGHIISMIYELETIKRIIINEKRIKNNDK